MKQSNPRLAEEAFKRLTQAVALIDATLPKQTVCFEVISVEIALAAARRLAETNHCADDVLALMQTYQERKGENAPDSGYWPMQSGALKRASLDLTRSLAKMRRRACWKSVFDEMQEDVE